MRILQHLLSSPKDRRWHSKSIVYNLFILSHSQCFHLKITDKRRQIVWTDTIEINLIQEKIVRYDFLIEFHGLIVVIILIIIITFIIIDEKSKKIVQW